MPPVPKHPSARARTNKVAGARTLHAVVDAEVPDLPAGREWRPETADWWRDVWSSPMAPEYDGSDVHGLIHLALLVDDFWCATSAKERAALSSEIRLQRQCFGLTPIDRRRLQWEIDRGEEADAKTRRRREDSKPKPAQEVSEEDPRRLLA